MEGLYNPGVGSITKLLPQTYTVTTLPTPTAALLQMYVEVTDLFGNVRDYVRCIQVGANFYWRPVAQTHAGPSVNIASSDLMLYPLKTPPVVLTNGTLLAARNIHMSTALAWPGATFNVGYEGNLGAFGITLKSGTGTSLGSLLAGGRRQFVFDGTDWQSF